MSIKSILLSASCLVVSAPLLAGTPECTNLDKAHWLPTQTMQKKFADQGYRVVDLKVADSCYKVRLETKRGQAFEGYYEPVTGYPLRRQSM